MKDYRHLLGGMIGGLALLAAYIIGWGVLQKCCGMEISRPAGDGVNTVTLEVDERGNVMSERSTAVYVPQRYIPQSGDRVVVDDFDYIMVSVADWERLTNAVARLEAVAERRWTKEHQTAEGRRAWHGAATNRVVSADGRSVTWYYADGYTYEEQAEAGRRTPPAARRMKQGETKRPARADMPRRLREKQEAMAARPKAKEVNATFGPGGRVIKAEGGK